MFLRIQRAPPWSGHTVPTARSRGYRCWRRRRRREPLILCAADSNDSMNIVFVTTEVAPWSKVGGLADVLAALPPALAARGLSVMTVAPRYAAYDDVPSTGQLVPLALPHLDQNKSTTSDGTIESVGATTSAQNSSNSIDGEQQQNKITDDINSQNDEDDDYYYAELYRSNIDNVDRVFVDHPLLRLTDIYGQTSSNNSKASLTYAEAGEFSELDLRYNVLCQAALAAPVLLQDETEKAVHGPVIFVANDWPTALLPVRLRYAIQAAQILHTDSTSEITSSLQDERNSMLRELQWMLKERLADALTVFCIHNVAYQGIFSSSIFPRLALPAAAMYPLCTASDWRQLPSISAAQVDLAPEEELEVETQQQTQQPSCDNGQVNLMRGALLTSDMLVTVSPGYAAELSEDDTMAFGFKDIISAKGIRGVMNGIDTHEWNPATDPHLPAEFHYTAATASSHKAAIKAAVQRELGLRVDPNAPLVAFIGRLTQQKGVDVLLAAVPAVLQPSIPPRPSPRAPLPLLEAAVEQLSIQSTSNDSNKGKGRVGRGRKASSSRSRSRSQSPSSARSHTIGGLSVLQMSSSRGGVVVAASNIDNSTCIPESGNSNGGDNMQLAFLGSGEQWMETALTGLQLSFPGQAVGIPKFSEEWAHKLLAAADFVLVPSRFEPCGLVAQCGVRYGAVPIVTAVGGLNDLVAGNDIGYTIPPLDPSRVNRQDVQRLVQVLQQAGAEWAGPRYMDMQQRCLEMDLSWEGPAEEWAELFHELVADSENRRRG